MCYEGKGERCNPEMIQEIVDRGNDSVVFGSGIINRQKTPLNRINGRLIGKIHPGHSNFLCHLIHRQSPGNNFHDNALPYYYRAHITTNFSILLM